MRTFQAAAFVLWCLCGPEGVPAAPADKIGAAKSGEEHVREHQREHPADRGGATGPEYTASGGKLWMNGKRL